MDDLRKAIMVSRIEPYMDKFTKFYKLGHIRLSEAESKEIAEMVREINPRYSTNYKLNCNSCLRDAITSLTNFYSRERNKVELIDTTPQMDKPTEIESKEPIKDEAYYNSLDKRSKEYKEWKKSLTQ